jgi:hypothetical protein
MREIIGNRGGKSLTMDDLDLLMESIETKEDIEETLQIFKEYVNSTIALGLGDERAKARNAEIAEALNPPSAWIQEYANFPDKAFKIRLEAITKVWKHLHEDLEEIIKRNASK